MKPNLVLKPNRVAFVYFNFLKSFLGTSFVFLIIFFLLISIELISFAILSLLIAFVFLLYRYFDLRAAYNKTNYNFYDSKIIVNTGTLFSNSSVELVVKNIVQATMIKPFIENKLFGVGVIQIKLAGSAGIEGAFNYIENPSSAYQSVEKIMQKNGFSLKKKRLIQKERPAVIGVLMNMLGLIVGGIFVVVWFVVPSFIAVFVFVGPFISIILLILILISLLIGAYINYMNLIKRKYYLYDDTIIFFEGFLTKVYSFIPVENLANSEITQSLFEKIFSIHDIKISCQGASHKIIFKNLKNGVLMERNIDNLIKNSTSLVGKSSGKKEVNREVTAMKVKPRKTQGVFFDSNFVYETKMDFLRSTFGLMFFALIAIIILFLFGILIGNIFIIFTGFFWILIAGIFAGLGLLVKIIFTKYYVLEKGISEKFDFLNKRNVEFSNEKITGIIFKKNFIDNFFDTFSVVFWSIGSSADINFKNIKENVGLKENFLSKIGINKEDEVYRINSEFNLIDFLKANAVLTILLFIWILNGLILTLLIDFSFIIIPIITLILFTILVFYKKWFYNTSKLVFTKNYLYFRAGIFFINEYYSLYDNVKDITTIRFPFTKTGCITFNVAGESNSQTQKNNISLFSSNDDSSVGETSFGIPHTFTINYSPRIDDKDELVDMILYKRLSKSEINNFKTSNQNFAKTILKAKPSVKNSLFIVGIFLGFFTIIASIFAFIISPILIIIPIILFILIISWIVISVKVMSYIIQPYRLVAKSGVFYKKQTSIVFNKIDHLTNHQGLINKIFRNGSIFVFTTGSSSVELFIMNIPGFDEFYKKLEDFYN